MRPADLAGWTQPADIQSARAAQESLAAHVLRHDVHGPVRRIGGVDVSSTRFDPQRLVHAAIVVLSWPDLVPLATSATTLRAAMPYIPGYLGFREIPALLAAWDALTLKPDLLLVDGQGVAHPRSLGIAAHLGVVLDLPSVGAAKSRLIGDVAGPLGEEPGATAALTWKEERIGTVLRTRRGANPIHVSIGHRVALDSAVAWVRGSVTRYRLPEPTRLAHLAANAERRRAGGAGGAGAAASAGT
jgi:deoxyribonuclease V